MIHFPNAKINIGLNVFERREDGYHNIESIFYPVTWFDAIEAIPADGYGKISMTLYGTPIQGSVETNLCAKAYNLLHATYNLPSLNVWLLKSMPMGAGLGGGSADAAFFLKMLNELCKLNLTTEELKIFASQIGSDCTFFIENKPALVSGKGEVITPVQLDLSMYYISIVYPQLHIDTKNAYSLLTPRKRAHSLQEIVLNTPIQSWKEKVINDFEEPIFKAHSQLTEIKNILYTNGALYASMTGSGSALYGIFDKKPMLADVLPLCRIWTYEPKKSV
ncbi:MAG TPA: 4-(cytidine 5'-diphospho)-2-C-methyl-D-erythritol kinase [Bacteroidia bacterium]|jgi:4-diphosphocytidyl-2-C-methyl-D-erythritol kinase|nr:4-(cytidine 5'-diphospho)-2-C-methyl-D-erythritol kinase [Bacteroidia bacterium]